MRQQKKTAPRRNPVARFLRVNRPQVVVDKRKYNRAREKIQAMKE